MTLTEQREVPVERGTLQRWEYRVEELVIHKPIADGDVRLENAREIEELGKLGWELVAVSPYPPYGRAAAIFKRPLR